MPERDFISEDQLDTFEGWLKYQVVDASTITAAQLATWRSMYDESRARSAKISKVGLMKLRPIPGEYRYAVAVEDGPNLWITLWVRRSPKGEFFLMVPRGDREWDVHTSYHLDGTLHTKSYGRPFAARKNQPLTGVFRGCVSLGHYAGHGPKGVGAICEPAAFSGVVRVPPGVLGPRQGAVVVDLVEPGQEPSEFFGQIAVREVFRDVTPWVEVTVGTTGL